MQRMILAKVLLVPSLGLAITVTAFIYAHDIPFAVVDSASFVDMVIKLE